MDILRWTWNIPLDQLWPLTGANLSKKTVTSAYLWLRSCVKNPNIEERKRFWGLFNDLEKTFWNDLTETAQSWHDGSHRKIQTFNVHLPVPEGKALPSGPHLVVRRGNSTCRCRTWEVIAVTYRLKDECVIKEAEEKYVSQLQQMATSFHLINLMKKLFLSLSPAQHRPPCSWRFHAANWQGNTTKLTKGGGHTGRPFNRQ